MEIKREAMTFEDNIEFATLVRDQVCAECGGELVIEGVRETDSLRIVCKANAEHTGYRQRDTAKTDERRGKEVATDVRDKIEATMMVPAELHRAMNLLARRFPDAIKDVAGAALFIRDCMRLGLDPLIQPAEAVPVLYNVKIKDKSGKFIEEKPTIVMITTEDGALSMAARGCPDEYDGAPATMPLLDYLMREHRQRPFEELEKMAARTAEELCGDPAAWVWVALGKRRSADTLNPVYGYFTQAERRKAQDSHKPAGTQPGNQARVRAIKRWVRENFPEAREKMLELTRDVARRTGGIPELDDYIDTEYRILDIPDKKPTLISPPGGITEQIHATKKARTKSSKQAENKVGESAERSTDQRAGQGGEVKTAAPSGADEHALVSVQPGPEMAGSREEPAATTSDGVRVNMADVREILDKIRWTDNTARSWFKQFNIDDSGTLSQVIGRANHDQVKKFIKEIQNRADGVQPNLFK